MVTIDGDYISLAELYHVYDASIHNVLMSAI